MFVLTKYLGVFALDRDRACSGLTINYPEGTH